MTEIEKEKLNKMKMEACMVMYVRFIDDNRRVFWSRDAAGKHVGNTFYWKNHLEQLALTKWPGRVKSYAIYRASNGKRIDGPWVNITLIE